MKFAFSLVLLTLFFMFDGRTQSSGSINGTNFHSSSTFDQLSIEGALHPKHSLGREKPYVFGSLIYDFVNDPIIAIDEDRTKRLFDITENAQSLRAGLGILFTPRLMLWGNVPYQAIKLEGQSDRERLLGDITAGIKWRFTPESSKWSMALIPYAIIAEGDPKFLNTDNGFGWGAKIALARQYGSLGVFLNIGYIDTPKSLYRFTFQNTQTDELDFRERVTSGIGFNYSLTKRLSLLAEAYGSVTFPFESDQNPIDVQITGQYKPTPKLAFFAGLGVDGVASVKSDELKFHGGLKFMLGSRKIQEKAKLVPKPTPKEVTETIETEVLEENIIEVLTKKLTIARETQFETNKAVIKTQSYKDLDSAANLILKYINQIGKIEIEGHTDSRGNAEYNLLLSQRRADSVKEYLVKKGVPSEKLRAIGYGESKPKVQEASYGPKREQTLQMNRRVEFIVSEEVQINK